MKQLAFVVLLGVCACKSGPAGPVAPAKPKVGVVIDVGGRGDQSFNDGALRGLELWAGGLRYTASGYQPATPADVAASLPRELAGAGITPLGITPVVLQAKAQEDYEPDLDMLAGEGVELAIGVGFMLENAVEAAAKKHPGTRFLLIDSRLLDGQGRPYGLPNVKTVTFREHEGSLLAGALAALASKSGVVGFVGGMEVPLIRKFEAGFVAGVRSVRPDTQVKVVYTGSFDDSQAGKRVAQDLFAHGVDVVMHAAGADGLGVLQAAKEQGKLAIGCDSDQAHVAPGAVLTSMVKHVDYAVYLAVKEIVEKRFAPGDTTLGLEQGAVALTPPGVRFTGEADALARVDSLRQAVVEHRLNVPATREEMSAFVPPKGP
jgi:basic membrane protein A